MKTPTPPSPATRQVVTGLARVGLFLKTQAREGSLPRGLSPTQAEILGLLERRFRGGARLGEVAEALGTTAPTASAAVEALVAKGLVRRERRAEDARALRLSLTPRGRREAVRTAEWPEALMAAVDELSGVERGVLLRSLVKMVRTLQVRGAMPVARMCAGCRFFRPHAHPGAARPHHCDFVDAPFADGDLRLDCEDHEAATPEAELLAWSAFVGAERGSPAAR
jgi:DNA-binding MarR family transcriptional regulator